MHAGPAFSNSLLARMVVFQMINLLLRFSSCSTSDGILSSELALCVCVCERERYVSMRKNSF